MWTYGEPKLSNEEFDQFTAFSQKRIDWFYTKIIKKPEEDGGCWIWIGAKRQGDYGMIRACGGSRMAHRVSWQIHKGPIPTGPDAHNKIFVLHDCPNGDDPRCVNPAHLWLGTGQDNMIDRTAKGRDNPVRGDNHWQRRNPGTLAGENNGMSKLTTEDVVEIRRLCGIGNLSYPQIGAMFNVDSTSIGLIKRGKTWRCIKD